MMTMSGRPLASLLHRLDDVISDQLGVVQVASSSVRENTTFGSLFICSATTGIAPWASGVGQKLTIIS